MHIPAVRLGLWCLHYAASVAAPLVVETGRKVSQGGWKFPQWGAVLVTVSPRVGGGLRTYLTPLSRLLVLAHM